MEDENDVRCGVGSLSSTSLRRCATVKCFTFFYSISGLLTSTLSVYVASQITTLEKQYGFNSKQTGFLMSCNEIGYLSVTLFVSFLAERLHAPRVLSFSTFLFGVAGILVAVPHFIFPVSKVTDQMPKSNMTEEPSFMPSTLLCDTSLPNSSLSAELTCSGNGKQSFIGVANEYTPIALTIMAIGIIIQGIGKSPRQAFITVFIDNNVPKTQTAVYIGCVIAVSIFGPALGFGLGGLFSRIYVTLEDVSFSPRDPRWIGAWWIGFLAFGIGSIISGFPVMCFPRRLLGTPVIKKTAPQVEKSNGRTLALSFFKQVIELLKNKLYVVIFLAKCLMLLVVSGSISFGPKYVETQFTLPAWKANILIGVSRVVTTSIGSFIGGLLTSRKKLTPLQCSKLIVIVSFLGIVYCGIGLGIGCTTPEIVGYNKFHPNITEGCYDNCHCDKEEFFPICGVNNVNYLSPCFAGCTSKSPQGFSNCSCIPDGGAAVPGLCPTSCSMLTPFILLSCVFGFLDALTIMPGLILTIRSVRENQKGIAIAFSAFITTLCGWFLGPLVFGEIIDICCRIWSSKCGVRGACALYDNDDFRFAIFGVGLGLRTLVFVFDFICYLIARKKTDWSTEDKFNTRDKLPEQEGFMDTEKETAILS